MNEYEDSTDITLEQNTCPLHYPTLGQRSAKLNTRYESHDSSTSLGKINFLPQSLKAHSFFFYRQSTC